MIDVGLLCCVRHPSRRRTHCARRPFRRRTVAGLLEPNGWKSKRRSCAALRARPGQSAARKNSLQEFPALLAPPRKINPQKFRANARKAKKNTPKEQKHPPKSTKIPTKKHNELFFALTRGKKKKIRAHARKINHFLVPPQVGQKRRNSRSGCSRADDDDELNINPPTPCQ